MSQNLGSRWQYPVILGLWPLGFLAAIVIAIVTEPLSGVVDPGAAEQLAQAVLLTVTAGASILWALCLVGYYSDSRALHDADADWQPSWLVYVLGSFFLTPLVSAPIYTIQRWRHLGIPWRELHPRYW